MVLFQFGPDYASRVNRATMCIIAQLLLDVSLEIGEYERALRRSCNIQEQKEGKKTIRSTSLKVVVGSLTFILGAALSVAHAVQGMDSRMTLILEGLSRLESAVFLFFMSHKTPRWIGVYYSPTELNERKKHVSHGLKALKFHVRWTLCQYFVTSFFLLLPFCGRPRSVVAGVAFGLMVSAVVYVARRRSASQGATIAMTMALFLALLSGGMFANGCSYVQRVWGTGAWRDETGLRLVSFAIWLGLVLLVHHFSWKETEKRVSTERRFSTHDRKERMAISLIFSTVFGSDAESRRNLAELEQIAEDETINVEADDEPTTWDLIKMRWAGPVDYGAREQHAFTLYSIALVCAVSLFVVIVNLGATAQMNVVRQNFDSVHHTLYGEMDQGPVCAFDKVDGNISTFSSQVAAHDAGYKIAHCGACGACSDWHNLRLQYTTRTYLAKASAKCARKSLTGGRSAVLECLHQEPVGFQGKCAECWAEDITCARNNCAFIFLQSTMINTMSNFQVGPDIITSATCEEAMCELEFVPCSGANRRRMSISSTIKRPGQQLCNIVDVDDWADVFQEDEAGGDSGNKEQEL